MNFNVNSPASYILCVAGEDSGDVLGAEVVRAARALGLAARGAGGSRMVAQGLVPLVPFEDLAVCGVGDVLRRLPRLRAHLATLRMALRSPACKGLVCLDYPGFNLRLKKVAEAAGKPVWYVAPPQIWAWKPQRGELFRGRAVAVLFPFEQEAYARFGAQVERVEPPAVARIAWPAKVMTQDFLLLPGSRLPQLRRNLPFYQRLARELEMAVPGARALFVASRPELARELERLLGGRFAVRAAADYPSGFSGARGVVCPPGTATLEAALAGVPVLATTVTDVLTYLLGRYQVRLPWWSLPNLLLGRAVVKETIFCALPGLAPTPSCNQDMARWLAGADTQVGANTAQALRSLLAAPALAACARKIINQWIPV
jgi:lipid-A-disaccharide synthase